MEKLNFENSISISSSLSNTNCGLASPNTEESPPQIETFSEEIQSLEPTLGKKMPSIDTKKYTKNAGENHKTPPSKLPYFDLGVAAGFPSPAADHEEQTLDLHELLIDHPTATFFVRVQGDSMIGAHICSGDLLIVDRACTPTHGKIVVALISGEFTVKRFIKKGNRIVLAAENPLYPPIVIKEEHEFQVWGVVTYVIHRTY